VIMWNTAKLVLLGALTGCAIAQNQFQTQFQDYDYPLERQSSQRSRPPVRGESSRQSPRRGQAPDTRGQPTTERAETTTVVAILKQINEHNEDGSYTYGYEAADGTFKLETRFVDGTVQGKYGYIDANGEVKIIEYGADAMGFQPQGDLPEGIIIPPPVEGNCTDCSYDYDYPDLTPDEETRRGVVSRARTSVSDQSPGQGSARAQLANQSRGQQLSQPITPAPLPRRVQSSQARPAAPAFQAAVPAFQPTPIPARPAPVRQEATQSPQRNLNANRSRSRGSSSRNTQPSRTREQSPIRIAAPANPSPPRSQSSSGGFANFPARGGNSAPSRPSPPRQAPSRQAPSRAAPSRQAPAAPSSSRAQPIPFKQPEQPRNTVPSFQNFAPQQNIQPAFSSRPAPPPSRPAITFQDPNPAAAQQRPLAPPANLPKSALEVVDFNQLLKEFQGRTATPSRSSSNPQRFAQAPRQQNFAAQPAVPGVFQSANFPVRF